jgi:predicted DNA-binding protein with PD1-like motif
MKYSQARQGRVFVIRLEHGEVVHEVIERFASEHNIKAAALIILGGADKGSLLVVGPEEGSAVPIRPLEHTLDSVHEIFGTGTLFPDESGAPILHMHTACGRLSCTVTGCIRTGVKVWQVAEVILYELCETSARRKCEAESGFTLLSP